MSVTLDIPAGVPFVVLRADAPLAAEAVETLAAKLTINGADSRLVEHLWAKAQAMREWRTKNPTKETQPT